MASPPNDDLPDANSPDLVLRHPTPEECITIWNNTSAEWIDSLTPDLYLKESLYLTTVPLAKNNGMTTWILVHRNLAANKRPILCSCETFRKRALTSDAEGNVKENIVHGIASVFCPTEFRGRGYAGRLMKELARELYTWQMDGSPSLGSTLYSDIGKLFYAKLGWYPNVTNTHVEISPKEGKWASFAKPILESDLEKVCKRDEENIRAQMAVPTDEFDTRFTIVPDLAHLGWHLGKETFATEYLFGKTPSVKGVVVGASDSGSQVWATWTHRYYGRHDVERTSNVLYILRLAVESDGTATRLRSDAASRAPVHVLEAQARNLKAVIRAAQAEAAEWKLDVVKLWDPTPLVMELLTASEVRHVVVERQKESIASLMWYDQDGGVSKEVPLWVNNEHYAWQ